MSAEPEKIVQWKETAWNGIRFEVPDSFELERIGSRHLAFGNEAGQTLEFKWAPVRGAFSHSKLIRRLIEAYGKEPSIRIEESTLPENWKTALRGFEVSGFVWEGISVKGKGVILYCPDCRKATLVQFYPRTLQQFDETERRILGSLQDHRSDGKIVWSVYDIRAVIPAEYALKRYRFEPGRFELSFVSGSSSITLYRWGPAAVLLTGLTLESFTRKAIPLAPDRWSEQMKAEERRVEFCFEEPAGTFRWRPRFRGKRACRVQVWHSERTNRILGVRFEANPPEIQANYHAIVGRYDTLS